MDGKTIIFVLFVWIFPLNVEGDSRYYEKAKTEGNVVLYTSLAGADTEPFKKAFEKRYPGITVEIYRSGGPKVLQKILAEQSAGREAVDVVLTQGPVLYALRQKHMLAKFDSPERNAFDERFKDSEGYWTDVYPTVHSIVYNVKMVTGPDIPRRYTDLLDGKWKGKLGLNQNNYMFVANMLHLYGKEKGMDYLKRLADQQPQVRAGGTLTATLVGAGEFPVAASVNANNVDNVKEKGAPVNWARVDEPYYGEPHPVSVMTNAPHPNAARLLAEFAISKEGQQLISDFGKMPARSDIQPKIGIDRSKLRILPPEEEAKTAYYQNLFMNLFVKRQ
ncbi:MAG: extracellular solute-binding protein [Deltaproteobacteria bacterium]|nr:extracellular solute-binding protein [Deltaproteobacteria bacterium]